MATEQAVKQLKRRHSARLLREVGVCGVGVERDDHGGFVLAVHLDSTRPDAGAIVPDSMDGCPGRRRPNGPFIKL